jgi:hypothetical protein
MKTCSLNNFLEELEPWLAKDYIRAAGMNDQDHFVLHFTDGTRNVYQIDDCTRAQIHAVLQDLKAKGIKVHE